MRGGVRQHASVCLSGENKKAPRLEWQRDTHVRRGVRHTQERRPTTVVYCRVWFLQVDTTAAFYERFGCVAFALPRSVALPESLCDVTSWLTPSFSVLSPPPVPPPLPRVSDSCLLIFLILSMSGGRGGRGGSDAEGGGAASLETAPGQVDTTPTTSVIAADVLNEVYS